MDGALNTGNEDGARGGILTHTTKLAQEEIVFG